MLKVESMADKRIGIIGLGRMGSAMARRLGEHGFLVTGWTRSGLSSDKAATLGITAAPSLASLCQSSDILILALLDDAAVHSVLDELAAAAPKGKLIVDTSTVSPQTLRSRAEQFAPSDAALLDAPISGGPDMVLAGKVGLYIGGREEDYRRFLPVAEVLSDRIHHVGGLGDGASAKLVNNMMLMGLWQSMKEALQLGGKAGLSRGKMIEILSGSPAASPAMKARLPVVLGESSAVGFPVSGVVKDARVVRDLAATLGIAIPAIAASLASFEATVEAGYGEADLATMVRLAAETN